MVRKTNLQLPVLILRLNQTDFPKHPNLTQGRRVVLLTVPRSASVLHSLVVVGLGKSMCVQNKTTWKHRNKCQKLRKILKYLSQQKFCIVALSLLLSDAFPPFFLVHSNQVHLLSIFTIQE